MTSDQTGVFRVALLDQGALPVALISKIVWPRVVELLELVLNECPRLRSCCWLPLT